jgi:hypothetical protein
MNRKIVCFKILINFYYLFIFPKNEMQVHEPFKMVITRWLLLMKIIHQCWPKMSPIHHLDRHQSRWDWNCL